MDDMLPIPPNASAAVPSKHASGCVSCKTLAESLPSVVDSQPLQRTHGLKLRLQIVVRSSFKSAFPHANLCSALGMAIGHSMSRATVLRRTSHLLHTNDTFHALSVGSVRCLRDFSLPQARFGDSSVTTDSAPWFRDGLSFKCTACGACCHKPVQESVTVNPGEVDAIAAYLGASTDDVHSRYLQAHPRYQGNATKVTQFDDVCMACIRLARAEYTGRHYSRPDTGGNQQFNSLLCGATLLVLSSCD